jgi:hypothetical protein
MQATQIHVQWETWPFTSIIQQYQGKEYAQLYLHPLSVFKVECLVKQVHKFNFLRARADLVTLTMLVFAW